MASFEPRSSQSFQANPAAVDTAHRLQDHHFTSALFVARLQRSRCLLDRSEYAFWTQVCDILEGGEGAA